MEEKENGQTILETGEYAVPAAGGDGELSEAGGKTEYYYRGMERDG